jgi:hypothetical protein
MMPLIPSTLATMLNPLFPVAVLMTVFALLAALVAAIRKKAGAAVGWLLLSGSCAIYSIASVPVFPDRTEAGGLGDSRAVGSSEVAYSSSNDGYFGYLSCLGAPTSCGWQAGTAPFLDEQLASLRTKQGYARSFVAGARGKGKPDPGIETFVYVATPVNARERRYRGFAIDHTGLICFTTDGTPPPIENGALSPKCTPLK